MSTIAPRIDVLPLAGGAPKLGPAGRAPKSAGAYLRRYGVQAHRKSHARLAAGLLFAAALLFARVWESTVANSLSMDRDRLRREVRTLENRIRLSTELRQQAALHSGANSRTLEAKGFLAPNPSGIVDVDLSQPVPRAEARR